MCGVNKAVSKQFLHNPFGICKPRASFNFLCRVKLTQIRWVFLQVPLLRKLNMHED